jgi:phosphatidylglycerophosphatase A
MADPNISSSAVKLLRLLGAGIAASLAAGVVMSFLVHVYFSVTIKPDPETGAPYPLPTPLDFTLVILFWSLPSSLLTALIGHITILVSLTDRKYRKALGTGIGCLFGVIFYFLDGGVEKLEGLSVVVSSFKIIVAALIGGVVGFTFFKVRDKVMTTPITRSASTSSGPSL